MRLNAPTVEHVHSFNEQKIQRRAAFGGAYIAMQATAVGTKMAVSPSILCEKAISLLSREDNPTYVPDGYHVRDSLVKVCRKLFILRQTSVAEFNYPCPLPLLSPVQSSLKAGHSSKTSQRTVGLPLYAQWRRRRCVSGGVASWVIVAIAGQRSLRQGLIRVVEF